MASPTLGTPAIAKVTSGNSVTISVTTTVSNEIILVFAGASNTNGAGANIVTSVAATGLTFTKLTSGFKGSTTGDFGTYDISQELWVATVASANTYSITVTWTSNPGDGIGACMVPVKGVYSLAAYLDSNVGNPFVSAGTTSVPTITYSTTQADDLLLHSAVINGIGGGTEPSGWSNVDSLDYGVAGQAYVSSLSVSTPQTSQTAAFGSSGWGGVGILVALTGDAASTDDTFDLTGLSAASAVGSLSIVGNDTVNLTGVFATSHVGSMTPTWAIQNVDLIGVSTSSHFGSFTITTPIQDILLTGVSTVSHVGSLLPTFPIQNLNMTGVSAVSHVGLPSVVFAIQEIPLIGVSAISHYGGSIPDILVNLVGVNVATNIGNFGFEGGASRARVFIIAGIEQSIISPGIVLIPTSEDIALSTAPYVVGSSQFYTIGQVYWNGVLKTQGTDWELVTPFTHIIQILVDPSTILTDVRFIYFKWDIQARSGFKINTWPVSFGFEVSSIIAERIPPINEYFTVQYTSLRLGNNPQSLIARYPIIVDDILPNIDIYDGTNGFQTYRPVGYQAFDESDGIVWQWDGSMWVSQGVMADATKFYVKSTKSIYLYLSGITTRVYTAGDGLNATYPQVVAYPPFGESVGKNFLVDAFSPGAEFTYPSAWEIAQNVGDYDPWIPDE